nr:unnamed protein product [Amyelois transitella]
MTYLFEEYLSNTILSAMEGDDTDNDYIANVAIADADVLQLHHYPIDRKKNNSDSEFYRKEGNKEYKSVMLQKALMSYNKAMAYAPSGSLALKLAYSNRSAVLFSVKKFSACLTDCNSALAIDCPTTASVTDKLRKRKLQATVENENLNMLRVGEDKTVSKFANEYLKLKSSNTEIPCASADIEVIIHNKIPKVIARRDIDAGELVALEEGFVTWTPTKLDMKIETFLCTESSNGCFKQFGSINCISTNQIRN